MEGKSCNEKTDTIKRTSWTERKSKTNGAEDLSEKTGIKSISLATLPFHFVFPSVPCVAPFVFNFCSVRCFLPSVSSSSFTIIYHHLPLPFVLPHSFRYILPFISTLTSGSFMSSSRFKSFISLGYPPDLLFEILLRSWPSPEAFPARPWRYPLETVTLLNVALIFSWKFEQAVGATLLAYLWSLGLSNTHLLLCSWLTVGFSDTLLLLRSFLAFSSNSPASSWCCSLGPNMLLMLRS